VRAGGFLTGDRARDQRNVDLLLGAVVELYGRDGVDDVVRHAVDRAIAVTGAHRGILLLDDAGQGLRVRLARDKAGHDLPAADLRYSRSVTQKVWTSGRPHLTVDAASGTVKPGRSITDLRLLSILAVPLAVKDKPIGVLYVDSTAVVKEFTEGDRAVFEALAGLVAVALEQVRLAAEESERKRLAAEMGIARRIQLSLQPRDLKPPPGYDLATEGRACTETSGDYHDVIPLSDGALALVVGDVTGHGLGAALFMACVRALLRMLLHGSKDPVAAVSALNGFLCRDMPEGTFMSLFLGILDPAAGTMRWVSAGHNAPLLARTSEPGIPVEELALTGPVLGVLPDATYRSAGPATLRPGDALFLYTDGLTEARGTDDMWGDERFLASYRAHVAKSPQARPVLDGVLADLEAFAKGRTMEDDVTCVVLRRHAAVPAGVPA
jgi:sigma-B regulation protein RsbU (phosphoserine phosphatase)